MDNNIQVSTRFDTEDSIINGINNINKDELENLWKPFYVIEKSRNKKFSGTGLGLSLSIVKEILEAHKYEYGLDINDDKIEFIYSLK